MWYAADHKGVAALLQFATDNAHLAASAESAPPLQNANDALAYAEELLVRTSPRCLMGWRDICRNTDERTVVGGVFPVSAVGNNLPLWMPSAANAEALPAVLSSFACDFAARFKVGGTHLNYFIAEQISVLPSMAFNQPAPWNGGILIHDWLLARTLELTYTAWDLQPFARDCGWDGPPFHWNEDRRLLLRTELDAAFFHLYLPSTPEGAWKPAHVGDGTRVDETAEQLASLRGHFPTPRDAVDYIMETFPIVKRKDEQDCGEYRTKRLILEVYDAMQQAMSEATTYRSRVDPPPADPRCCHPPQTESA